ncbi:MAG: ATP-binding protein [Pyrinomonadaceae bacterium]
MSTGQPRSESGNKNAPKTGGASLQSPEWAAIWLASLIESADDAIISKTLDGIITSWNHGAERIFGYTAEEAIGKPVAILIPPDHTNEEPAILARLRAGERVEHYETVRVRKDGTLVDISLTVSPIRGPDGQIFGASKVARDISERKRNEEALREQADIIEIVNRLGQTLAGELDLDKLVQAVTDGATEVSGARFGAFFYNALNKRDDSYKLYALSGVPPEAFEDFPLSRNTEIFGPTFKGEGTVLIDNVKEDPRYGKNSPYYGLPEGYLPVTSYLAVPIVSRSGEIYGGLFFGHEDEGVFSEREARIVEGLAAQASIAIDNARLYEAAQVARADAEEAAGRAEESSRLKEDFLATISHELRTPLNAILGYARILRTGKLQGEDARKAVDTIERNAWAQAQLIEDLLDVSRIITGKLRMEVRPTDPTAFTEAAIEAVQPAAEAKGVQILKILDTTAVSVPGDPARLQQVVWNLLSNAVKFTPRGGKVQVRVERVNSHIEIVVSDTGQGISADFLPHVFDRFRQAEQSTSRQHGGMGLGLAIVRHLVELHGGTVEASSSGLGQGAMFSVRLPISAAYHVDPDAGRIHPTAQDLLLLPESADRLDGIKIVIVDDEPDTRELLRTGLSQCGAEVTVVSSAAEAFEAVAADPPAVIISDIGMPAEDGYDLIRRLRALPAERGGKVPAVALTAYARVEDRLKALRAGYQMHVPKPVELTELIAVVGSLVERGR